METNAMQGRRSNSMIWLRGALVALGALLGIVLLAKGWVLIGGILLVMAVVRTVLLVQMHSRRKQWLQRREQGMQRRQGRWQGQ